LSWRAPLSITLLFLGRFPRFSTQPLPDRLFALRRIFLDFLEACFSVSQGSAERELERWRDLDLDTDVWIFQTISKDIVLDFHLANFAAPSDNSTLLHCSGQSSPTHLPFYSHNLSIYIFVFIFYLPFRFSRVLSNKNHFR
jgi:hypothetical protein